MILETDPFVFLHQDTIYRQKTFLVIGSRKELLSYLQTSYNKRLNHLIYKDAIGMGFAVNVGSKRVEGSNKAFFVWFVDFDLNDSDDIGSLTHECYHSMVRVFEHIGLDIAADEEATAYYLDSLVNQFYGALQKRANEVP